jgi:hypothetical protein
MENNKSLSTNLLIVGTKIQELVKYFEDNDYVIKQLIMDIEPEDDRDSLGNIIIEIRSQRV